MFFAQAAAATLQTFFILAFVSVLTPFRFTVKKSLTILGGIALLLCAVAGVLAAQHGTAYLKQYGYLFVSLPLFLALYLLSAAKGVRYFFVVLTAFVFHEMLCILLMSFRVWGQGFTLRYFLLNFILFGTLLGGGLILRKEFHKIVFSYRIEFFCLNIILLLLFIAMWGFTPIVREDVLDTALFRTTLYIDLLVILLYVYIGVSFHSLGRRIDTEKESLSLRFQMEEADKTLTRLRGSQSQFVSWQQDWQGQLSLLRQLLEQGETDKLRSALADMQQELDNACPESYCQNEAVDLLLASYSARAGECGIRFVTDTHIPGSLSIGSTELCALLGNALDNAFRAAQAAQGAVELTARLSNGKLLIQVRNSYVGEVWMENGLPRSPQEGQGFGVKSMESIVEKYGGVSTYRARDGFFTVRIAL